MTAHAHNTVRIRELLAENETLIIRRGRAEKAIKNLEELL